MAWARVDDAFDDHEKVLALLDLDGGVAAVGLWTLCLTWANRNTRKKGRKPGLLPGSLPRRFAGPDGKAWADLLVRVGLWDEVEVEGGWVIHDFADYLPGKELSEARAAAGKRGAAARWANRQNDGKLPSGDGKGDGTSMAADVDQPAHAGETAVNSSPGEVDEQPDGKLPSPDGNLPSESHSEDGKSMASDGSRARARREWAGVGSKASDRTSVPSPQDPAPSEPVASGDGALIPLPTKTTKASAPKGPEPGSDDDPQWLRFWAIYPNKVSKKDARIKWARLIRSGVSPDVIIAGATRFAAEMRRQRRPKDKIKYPDAWLNGERWDDELDEDEQSSWSWDEIDERTPGEFN